MNLYEHGAENTAKRYDGMINALYVTGNVWMGDGMAVRVIVNCS